MNVYEDRSTVLRWRKKIVQINVILLSSYEAGKLLIWWNCQSCIWCQCHQIHWRLNEISELLHLMLKSLNALTKLSWCQYVAFGPIAIRWEAVDVQIAAFDCDEVRCTGEFFLISELLHLMPMSSDARWRLSVNVRETASDFERSDALAKLFDCQTAALDRETIRCTLAVAWLTRIKWSWLCVENMMSEKLHLISNCQINWRNCFLMSEKLHSISNHQMNWRDCLIVRLLHLTVMQSNARWRLFFAKVRCSWLTATSFAMKSRCCIRCWCYQMQWQLFEFFVDWEFMREFVHKFDQKENKKENEIRFQIIRINVVLRWSTFWLWKLFFFIYTFRFFKKFRSSRFRRLKINSKSFSS